MKAVHPYVNFPGNAEEAFNFYRSVFGGEFDGVFRYRDIDMGVPPEDLDKLMHIALPIGNGTLLMGTDMLESLGQSLSVGNNHFIHLDVENEEEAQTLFRGLAEGGTVKMPLEKVDWAETFGICTDRFGVQWMVNYTGSVAFAPAAG